MTIESAAFAGARQVERQRLVYGALAEELAGPVHALSVKALAPGDPAQNRLSAPGPMSGHATLGH